MHHMPATAPDGLVNTPTRQTATRAKPTMSETSPGFLRRESEGRTLGIVPRLVSVV